MASPVEPRIGAVAVRAAQHYLTQNGPAQDYLISRGFDAATQTRWHMGYWNRDCLVVLGASGFDEAEINESGYGSRLLDRITLPLYDPAGRPCGLVGRSLDPHVHIKWLYPPNNKFYVSGYHLFGLHQALQRDWSQSTPILVEGPFDVIALQEAGYLAISPHHASFTDHQAALLRALHREKLILLPDADTAGEAMLRSAQKHRRFLPHEVCLALLPSEDPAYWIQNQLGVVQRAFVDSIPIEEVAA